MLNTTIRSLRDTRYWGLVYLTGFFVLLSFLTRLGLVVTSGELLNQSFLNTFSVFAIGLLYDLGAVAYVIAIAGLVAALVPDGLFGRRFHGMLLLIGWPVLVFGALFVATAEFLFWNEFSSRFNFIAVDYLVYTREVIGNIRESYSAGWILTALGCLTVIISVFTVKPVWWAARAAAGNWRRRCAVGLLCLMVPMGSFYALNDSPRLLIENSVARELAGNGYYDFMRAFRNNDLDFKTFYATILDYEAESANLAEFEKAQTSAVFSSQAGVINRRYIGRENSSRLNVVLVTMESMGAEYVGALGVKGGLHRSWMTSRKRVFSLLQPMQLGSERSGGLRRLLCRFHRYLDMRFPPVGTTRISRLWAVFFGQKAMTRSICTAATRTSTI